MVWQRGEGCGADARLQAAPLGAEAYKLAVWRALRGGSVVVVVRESAHSGTSSMPDSRHQGKKIKSKAALNALAVQRLDILSHELWKFLLS